ncbi:hypothetical protein GTGU_04699 [Trabulsiella guamensis ATCC 49490]|uniref:Uncharacterized protein n=1 Tax=Trabulsiella guamensis ATCC 49490 TaxID=1005994 RepID=A0A084ZD53_9ENTR|nr:hypothetical protein [Trabulsiella guamensis]KFB95397.1 hypothetical protein GTGU_04699 [Trabulsiella guamensis ATCC 49490]
MSTENNRLPKEVAYAHAIQLASAFISNGDIRLKGSTRPESDSFEMTMELIETLYQRVQDTWKHLD